MVCSAYAVKLSLKKWIRYSNVVWLYLTSVSWYPIPNSNQILVPMLYNTVVPFSHSTGMETVFQEYQSFSDDSVNEESLPAYIRAKKKLEEYLPFENKLVRKNECGYACIHVCTCIQSHTHTQLSFDPPSLDSYRAYISHAMATKSDPTFINILYQRAIADHSLGTKLWHDYLGFLVSVCIIY